jgi:hypothetical protein
MGEPHPGGEAAGGAGERRAERPPLLPGDEAGAGGGQLRPQRAVPAELVEEGVARARLRQPERGADAEQEAGRRAEAPPRPVAHAGGPAGSLAALAPPAPAEQVGGEDRADDPEGEGERQALARRGIARRLHGEGEEGDGERPGEGGEPPAAREGTLLEVALRRGSSP